jgi:hypothetical protein
MSIETNCSLLINKYKKKSTLFKKKARSAQFINPPPQILSQTSKGRTINHLT